jgi:hypothetical protein
VDPQGTLSPVIPHVGFGALLRVDAATGQVSLVADGTNYTGIFPDINEDGLPEPSVFLDPWAVAADPMDPSSVFVIDTLADPLDEETAGAVFRVWLSTGEVEVVTTDPRFFLLNDVAWSTTQDGLLVLDSGPALGDPNEGGAIFLVRYDPVGGTWVTSVWADPPVFKYASGIVVDDQDSVFVVDFDADPFSTGAYGAVWQLPAADPNNPLVASSGPDFYAIVAAAAVPRSGWPSADAVSVPVFCNNRDVTLQITGSSFDPGAAVGGDGSVEVRSYRWIGPGAMEAVVFASCDVLAGSYTLRVVNPGGLTDPVPVGVDPGMGGGPPRSPVGDINADLLVDGLDLAQIGIAFGGRGGCCDPGFEEDADLNDDGRVDGLDVAVLAASFGRSVTP